MGGEEARAGVARGVCGALEAACAGSRAQVVGSLAAGADDAYSDIDVEWVVPDPSFAGCVTRARSVLERVRSVADVRIDPDFRHSDRRRLLFVRFEGLPLFWRLDPSVRAGSVAGDASYDVGNPRAWARDDEWSRPASAPANAVGAVKAVARRRPEHARGLLDRGFDRIGVDDRAIGAWTDDIARPARASADQEPALTALAAQVVALAAEHAGDPGTAHPGA